MKNILDIVYEYSRKRYYLDTDAIKKIIDILIKENDLDFIKKINVENKTRIINLSRINLGVFNCDNLTIYYSTIMKYIDLDFHKTDFIYEDKLTIYDTILRNNLYILYIIFHEIEHAIDYKNNIDSTFSSIRKDILSQEFKYLENIGYNNNLGVLHEYYFGQQANILSDIIYYTHRRKEKKLYKSNYDISVVERVADITAIKKIINMMEEIKNQNKLVYDLQKAILLDYQITNYIDYDSSPTIELFNNLGISGALNSIDIDNLPFEERILLGLNLNKEEIDKTFKLYFKNVK